MSSPGWDLALLGAGRLRRMSFTGFPKAAPRFFDELASEMTREWFQKNKERYQRDWVAPMQALLDDVASRLTATYKPLVLSAPKVMRIHRDVRFSKDKAPYKTHIGAVITLAGKRVGDGGIAAMYIHSGVEEEFVGVGMYMFDAARLTKWRKAVGGKPGVELMKLVTKLRSKAYTVGGYDDYKKVPRGFPEDPPRGELLKMKGITAGPGKLPKGILHQATLAGWIVEHGKALAPLVKWLHQHVG